MGSAVGKVVLPLVALGGLGAMTGGFGLLGAAAGASAAGAAGTAGLGGWLATHKTLVGASLGALGSFGLARQGLVYDDQALRIEESQAALTLAQQERDSQQRLLRTLARQNNFFAAAGVEASSGSALQAAQGAEAAAGQELSLYGAQRSLSAQQAALERRRHSSSGAVTGALLNFVRDVT